MRKASPALFGAALALVVAVGGCVHVVCVTDWEARSGVNHSKLFGPGVEQTLGVSGHFGDECSPAPH